MKAGLNRLVWDLRYEGAVRVPDYYLYEYESGSKGPFALPGQYTLRFTADGKSLTQPLELKLDPRLTIPPADLEKQFTLLIDVRDQLTRVYSLSNQILDLRKQISEMKQRVNTMPSEAQGLDERLEALQKKLLNTEIRANEDSLKFGMGIDGDLADIAMIAGGDVDSRPDRSLHRSLRQTQIRSRRLLRSLEQNRLRRRPQSQTTHRFRTAHAVSVLFRNSQCK